jgi:hypothetical protein
LHSPSPGYESGASLSMLSRRMLEPSRRIAPRVSRLQGRRIAIYACRAKLVPVEGLAPSRRPYQGRHTLSCVDRRIGIPSWTRTNAISLRRAHAAVLRSGYSGGPPGFRTQPFPLIWQVSRVYKSQPLTRATDHKLASMAGVEPAPATFVASSPKSLGPWTRW